MKSNKKLRLISKRRHTFTLLDFSAKKHFINLFDNELSLLRTSSILKIFLLVITIILKGDYFKLLSKW